MKSSRKHTFYPEDVVEKELKEIPRGKFSERINELILKGLEVEKQEAIALAYHKYNSELDESKNDDNKLFSKRLMSEPAFQSEDEVEDFV